MTFREIGTFHTQVIALFVGICEPIQSLERIINMLIKVFYADYMAAHFIVMYNIIYTIYLNPRFY